MARAGDDVAVTLGVGEILVLVAAVHLHRPPRAVVVPPDTDRLAENRQRGRLGLGERRLEPDLEPVHQAGSLSTIGMPASRNPSRPPSTPNDFSQPAHRSRSAARTARPSFFQVQ